MYGNKNSPTSNNPKTTLNLTWRRVRLWTRRYCHSTPSIPEAIRPAISEPAIRLPGACELSVRMGWCINGRADCGCDSWWAATGDDRTQALPCFWISCYGCRRCDATSQPRVEIIPSWSFDKWYSMLYIRDSSNGLINGPPSFRLRHCTDGISGLDRREHSTGASRILLMPHKWVNRARAVYASVSNSAASLGTPLM